MKISLGPLLPPAARRGVGREEEGCENIYIYQAVQSAGDPKGERKKYFSSSTMLAKKVAKELIPSGKVITQRWYIQTIQAKPF